jgi:hypothetical protein
MKFLLPLLWVAALCGGCTSVSVRKPPAFDLGRFHRIFVEQPFNENHHLDEIMAEQLRTLGHEASSGPLTMMPENTDAVLTYNARWTWDFKTYLIELDVSLHTAHTKKLLAEGRYYQPSITTKPPETVVRDLLAKLFAK